MQRKRRKSIKSKLTSDPASIITAEERSLMEAIADGDTTARERMIMNNLGLATRIALKWTKFGLDPEDLISEATCGLIRAVDQYDPSHGVPFRTYAKIWIKHALTSAVEQSGSLIALPEHIQRLVRTWKRGARALTTTLGRTPTTDEITESLGFTSFQVRGVETAIKIGVKPASTVIGEGSNLSLLESKSNREAPEEPAGRAERKLLRQRLKRLDRRERLALSMRYGLEGNPPHSLRELRDQLGMSCHAIRMIQLDAERKLRRGPNPRSRP